MPAFLPSCMKDAKPVPPKYLDYIGNWDGDNGSYIDIRGEWRMGHDYPGSEVCQAEVIIPAIKKIMMAVSKRYLFLIS